MLIPTKRRIAVGLAALLFILGCAEQPDLPPLSQNDNILAFGDSLTVGVGAKPAESYPTVLQSLIGFPIDNAGVSGNTTRDGIKRLEKALDQSEPELVLLLLGGNDFLRKIPESETKANLAKMIETIQGRGIPLVLIAVPQPGLILSDADLYEELAERYRIPLFDDVLTDLLRQKQFKSDAIHLNRDGYFEFALAMQAFLVERGAVYSL